MNYARGRLPYGAITLRNEIAKWDPKALFEPDDPDGLGVYRVLIVDTDRAKDLAELLAPVVAVDSRIVEVYGTAVGVAITFTTGQQAESRQPFHLPKVAEVFDAVEETPEEEPSPVEPPKPVKKTTAKKTAKKSV